MPKTWLISNLDADYIYIINSQHSLIYETYIANKGYIFSYTCLQSIFI